MNPTLIFYLSNDSLCVASGSLIKGKPCIFEYRIREYDNLLNDEDDFFDYNFLYKELYSMINEMSKKYVSYENVSVILPDTKVDCYVSNAVIYPSSESSIITNDDIRSLYISAEKKQNLPNKKIISIIPSVYETDKSQFSKPPVGEISSFLKMNYTFYFIDEKMYYSITKLFAKLGIKSPSLSYNIVELSNLIKINKNYPSSYILADFLNSMSTISLIGSNVPFYNSKLKLSYMDLLNDIVSEYDVPYSDVKKILTEYGYDEKQHPVNVCLYSGKNSFDVDVKIYQKDINQKIDSFIEKLAKELNDQSLVLKSFAKVPENAVIPLILSGELAKISGFASELEKKINKKLIIFDNDVSCFDDRFLFPCISAIHKLNEFNLNSINNKKVERVSNVTRGE